MSDLYKEFNRRYNTFTATDEPCMWPKGVPYRAIRCKTRYLVHILETLNVPIQKMDNGKPDPMALMDTAAWLIFENADKLFIHYSDAIFWGSDNPPKTKLRAYVLLDEPGYRCTEEQAKRVAELMGRGERWIVEVTPV